MGKKIAQWIWNKTKTKVIQKCNKTISSAVEMTQVFVSVLFFVLFQLWGQLKMLMGLEQP